MYKSEITLEKKEIGFDFDVQLCKHGSQIKSLGV